MKLIAELSSPLEQFEFLSFSHWLTFLLGDHTLSLITNASYFLALPLVGVVLVYKFSFFILNSWVFFSVKNLVIFIQNMLLDHVSKRYARIYYPVMLSIFLIIVSLNIIGLLPYSFAVTSHFIFTMWLSAIVFFTVTLKGIQKHGVIFLQLFLPAGVPYAIAPFLVLIELISYIARLFSLGIRLFANIMAGHTLLKILASFSWLLISYDFFYSLGGVLCYAIVLSVNFLEVAITFLQAYVFVILSIIYLSDAFNLH